MDMSSHRHEPEQDPDDHIAAIADPIVHLMCVASSGYCESSESHQADMLTLLALISVRVLQHNHKPGDYDSVLADWDRHCDLVRGIFIDHRDAG